MALCLFRLFFFHRSHGFFSARFKDCDIFYVCVFVLFRSSIWLIYRCFLSLSAFSHSLLFSVRFIFLLFFFFFSRCYVSASRTSFYNTHREREEKKNIDKEQKNKVQRFGFLCCVVVLFLRNGFLL